jgi:hypothetical protein
MENITINVKLILRELHLMKLKKKTKGSNENRENMLSLDKCESIYGHM